MSSSVRAFKVLNGLAVIGLSFVVLAASVLQFVLPEIPCPLCLLQRLALISICFGLYLNVRNSSKPSHYAFAMLGSLFAMLTSGCQVLMHITPGSSTYAQPVLGLGMYTWTFIIAFLVLLFCIVSLLNSSQFSTGSTARRGQSFVGFAKFLGLWLCLILLLNVITTFLECGFGKCPSNSTQYKYLLK